MEEDITAPTELNTTVEETAPAEHNDYVSNTEVDKARRSGWIPQEEYKGNPRDWVDAEEFNRRGPAFNEVKKLNRQIAALAKTNKDLMGRFHEADIKGYNRALADLQEKYEEAVQMGDRSTAKAAQAAIDDTTAKKTALEQQNQAGPDPAAIEFVNKNKDWFALPNTPNAGDMTKVEMSKFAVMQEHAMKAMHPDWSTEEVYDEVESLVKLKYPKYFNVAKPAPVKLESGSSRGETTTQGSTTYTTNDLTQDAREVFTAFKKVYGKEYTLAEFVKEQLACGNNDIIRGK